jgi:HSP20 family protein
VEFAIPGAPADTVDVKILEDSVHLTAPARDIDYVASLALGWPVKPDKAEATYEYGLLRIEVPFKDPMEDAVKLVIKVGGGGTVKNRKLITRWTIELVDQLIKASSTAVVAILITIQFCGSQIQEV